MLIPQRSFVLLVTVVGLLSGGCATQLSPGDYLRDPRLGASTAQRTILFVLSKQCEKCNKNMPIYRRLAARRAKAGMKSSTLRFVLATDLGSIEATTFLQKNQLQMDDVVRLTGVSSELLGREQKPTLLLLDHSGKIRDIWTGPSMFQERCGCCRRCFHSAR